MNRHRVIETSLKLIYDYVDDLYLASWDGPKPIQGSSVEKSFLSSPRAKASASEKRRSRFCMTSDQQCCRYQLAALLCGLHSIGLDPRKSASDIDARPDLLIHALRGITVSGDPACRQAYLRSRSSEMKTSIALSTEVLRSCGDFWAVTSKLQDLSTPADFVSPEQTAYMVGQSQKLKLAPGGR
jgi:hypothetical protein